MLMRGIPVQAHLGKEPGLSTLLFVDSSATRGPLSMRRVNDHAEDPKICTFIFAHLQMKKLDERF